MKKQITSAILMLVAVCLAVAAPLAQSFKVDKTTKVTFPGKGKGRTFTVNGGTDLQVVPPGKCCALGKRIDDSQFRWCLLCSDQSEGGLRATTY